MQQSIIKRYDRITQRLKEKEKKREIYRRGKRKRGRDRRGKEKGRIPNFVIDLYVHFGYNFIGLYYFYIVKQYISWIFNSII